MASLLMMGPSFLGGGAAKVAERRPLVNRRSIVVAKAAGAEGQDVGGDGQGSNGRRAVMFAAAAISVVGIGQGTAVAGDGDLKRGTVEAKKAYAPVCVTMPTARICHK